MPHRLYGYGAKGFFKKFYESQSYAKKSFVDSLIFEMDGDGDIGRFGHWEND